jgi:hypothetical protein
MMYAGKPCTGHEIRATICLLRYYRGFLASDCSVAIDPEDRWRDSTLTKDQARPRLAFLLHTAINRKAGIPDVAGRKQEADYRASLWRDCHRVRDRVNRRVIVRQFETREVRARFGHLLTTPDDE